MSLGDFLKNLALAGVPRLTSCTWETRPASPAIGDRIRLTDHRNNVCVWNGSLWIPQGVWAQSAVASSVTGTTVEAQLASITIPGGLLGPNGVLRVTHIWSATNNANVKTMRFRFSGASLWAAAAASFTGYHNQMNVRNRGVDQQIINPFTAYGVINVAANSVQFVNTAVDQAFTLCGTLAAGTDTLTLEGYTLEVLPA